MDARQHTTETVPPTGQMVTPAEAAAYLGGVVITDATQSALLDLMIAAATDFVDGHATDFGWCFRERTLELALDDWCGEVTLPGGAVRAISAVTLDGNPATDYETEPSGRETVLTVTERGDWRVTYTVGAAAIPPQGKLALLRLVATFWAKRAAVMDAEADTDVRHMLRHWTVISPWEQ